MAMFYRCSRLRQATKDAIHNARICDIRASLRHCGEEIVVQFPIVIIGHDQVSFGSKVALAAYVHIWGKGGVTIGDRVMIGTHTSISSLTHDYDAEPMWKTLIQRAVTIEDDVWIGSNCVILPGVTVGCGAVVGAGAVVTRDVEPYHIVAGVPAHVIGVRSRPKQGKSCHAVSGLPQKQD